MGRLQDKLHKKRKRALRTRVKNRGTAERPRLSVTRSLKNISVQIIDDKLGHTLAAASTLQSAVKDELGGKSGGNVAAATVIGRLIAERAKEKGITQVRFDRGSSRYHGRVKALADAAREAGLEF